MTRINPTRKTIERATELSKPKRLILYSRTYCHLCGDMLTALENLRGEFAFSVTVIDVDSDPIAVERYDELVPVLTDGEGVALCHYHLDVAKVRRFLAGREE